MFRIRGLFVEVEPGDEAVFRLPKDNLLKLLMLPDSDWRLHGDDECFARWIFSLGGLITISKACQEGDRVKILSGPLKDLEGCILRVDKRNRSGQILLTFNEKTIKAWLGFDLVEKQYG